MPEMLAVDSSCLSAVGYEARSGELHVRFRDSGKGYAYFPLEDAVFQALLRAESKGRFFNERIKPHYQCRALEDETRAG